MNPLAIDDSLARRAGTGDQRAQSRIFREFHQPLYRYCLAILGNRQDAEDALQETMIKALGALPGEQREISLKPWLYRIAHNQSIDLLRRRRANVSLEDTDTVAGDGLAEQVETRQRLRQLIADLGGLPERQRGVLLMREAGGLDFDEIAAALGTSPAVARQTLYEARLGLRQMDAGRDMECAAVTHALSDGDRRVRRRRDIRAHLRDCSDCRRFAEAIDSRRNDLAAISPLPAVAAAALLQGVLGGGAGAGAAAAGGAGTGAAGGAGGLVAGTAVKSVGTATVLKGAAVVAAVAAIGVGAADRGGLIDVGAQDRAPATRSGGGNGGRSSSEGATLHPAGSRADSTEDRAGHAPDNSTDPSPAVSRADTDSVRGNSTDPAASKPLVTGVAGESDGGSPGKSGVEHPHGRGHEKQTPSAAAHGQETAAGKKPEKTSGSSPPAADESGGSKATGASPPVHPTHPSHPTDPGVPSESASPPSATVPAPKSEGKKPE